MKAFTTIAIFLSALNVAYTLPTESLEVAEFTLDAPAVAVPAIDNQLVERAKQTLLRTCTNDNFDGRCLSWTANSRSTACTNTAGNGQQDNISSIQVFGTRCTFWVYVLPFEKDRNGY
jgi:hypothetical protein